MSDASPSDSFPLRISALVGARYVLRLLHEARTALQLDLTECEVLWTVAVASLGGALERGQLAPDGSDEDLAELRRAISRLAISRATGLNRETVRRCVNRLLEAKLLEASDGGVCITSDYLARPGHAAFWRYAVRQILLCEQELRQRSQALTPARSPFTNQER
jgi:hypothetical protein